MIQRQEGVEAWEAKKAAEGKIKGAGTRACLEPSAISITGSTEWGGVRAVLKLKALQLLVCRRAAYASLCRHALECAP